MSEETDRLEQAIQDRERYKALVREWVRASLPDDIRERGWPSEELRRVEGRWTRLWPHDQHGRVAWLIFFHLQAVAPDLAKRYGVRPRLLLLINEEGF